jgi:hypothetical protein
MHLVSRFVDFWKILCSGLIVFVFSIHDPAVMVTAATSTQATGGVANATDSETSESPTSPSAPHLPTKPVSALEESRKKGFFPISWRVIGGGVMMGGKSTCMRSSVESGATHLAGHQGPPCQAFLADKCADGDDCKFSHDVDDEYEGAEPSMVEVEPQSPPPVVLNVPDDVLELNNAPPVPSERRHTRKHKHTSTQSLSITLPPDKESLNAELGDSGTTRPRSMCITPTSRMDYTSVSSFPVRLLSCVD